MRGAGPRVRAKPPLFVAKKVCPKQLSTKCAATRVSLDLYKLINRLDELFVRISREVGSPQDGFNTARLAVKAYHGVQRFCKAIVWTIPSRPTLVEIHLVRRWAETFASTLDSRIRLKRIQSWKKKITQSAENGCAYIFQHLRQKAQDEPPNLVTNSLNQIVTQPEEAIQTLNEAWDDIFAANVLSEHPLKMLEAAWPYIHDIQVQVHLPPVSPKDLFQVIQKRKKQAAPGLDGWRTQEPQALHPLCFHVLALFFKSLEESNGPFAKSPGVCKASDTEQARTGFCHK